MAILRAAADSARRSRMPHLAVSVSPGQAAGLVSAVKARVEAEGHTIGTVIVILREDGTRDGMLRAVLSELDDELRHRGFRFRLVTREADLRQQMADLGQGAAAGRLAVHETLRSAVLASYAELPGPGLVTSAVRTALVAHAEPLIAS